MRYWSVILKFIWWSVNLFWKLYLAISIYAVYAKIEKYISDLFLLDHRQYHIFSGESQWMSSKWIQFSPCVSIHPSCQGDAAILKILKFYYLDYPWFCSIYKNLDPSCLKWHFQAPCIVSSGILMLSLPVPHSNRLLPPCPILCHHAPLLFKQVLLIFYLRTIILQTSEDCEQRLLPCTLYSRQLLKPERNCDVLNKEYLVIRDAFQHWHTSCKKLHIKQTTRSWSIYSLFHTLRWAQFSQFNFHITGWYFFTRVWIVYSTCHPSHSSVLQSEHFAFPLSIVASVWVSES